MQLTNEQKLSFFINLYNVLILHANVNLGFPDNTVDARSNFFRGNTGALYNIGGHNFSPDDIEHGILRANHAHPSGIQNGDKYFIDTDPRSKLALTTLDPRIHFILNCGASSCPPLRVCGDDPEKVLKSAANAYLSQGVTVDFDNKIIKMPKLLMWYGKDFGDTIKERLEKIVSMLPEENSVNIRKLLKEDVDNYIVEYDNYDWTNNNVK